MLGDVIEKAAELADRGEGSVDHALLHYEQSLAQRRTRAGNLWVSVAFLFARHLRHGKGLID